MNELTGSRPLLLPRTAAVVAIGAVTVSLASMALLHAVAASRISPLGDTVSSYVHADGGAELLAVGTLALAFGFAAVAYGLVATGVRVDRATRTLAAVWLFALVCVVSFPADVVGGPRTFPGVLHNWAGGSVFVCLPAAGWRLSGALTGHWQGIARTVRVLALGAGVALLAFVVTHPPITRWYGGTALHGLSERVLLVLQVGIVLVLSHRLLRYADPQQTPARAARPEVLR
ncbi:MAG: DUF998 domain-containing protein [Micromonosporaceae bacterium]